MLHFYKTYSKEETKTNSEKEKTKTYTQEDKTINFVLGGDMFKILEEYLHLQKTKSGINLALMEKEVELATECRRFIAGNNPKTVKMMAEVILGNINGR